MMKTHGRVSPYGVAWVVLIGTTCLPLTTWAVEPTPAEMTQMRQWCECWFGNVNQRASCPASTPGIMILHASYHTRVNVNGWGQPITLRAQRIQHGIYVDAPNRLRVVLPKPARRFTARVGIDNNPDTQYGATQGHGSTIFQVLADDRQIARTEVLTLKTSPQSMDVVLKGATTFDLVVDPAGDRSHDQSVWGDPTVFFEDGSSMTLDTLPISNPMKPQIPFSFLYDGKPSAEHLSTWQKTVRDEPMEAGRSRRIVSWKDSKTGLVCEMEAVRFDAFPAVDWVLRFRNEGTSDTPILEQVRTLDALWPVSPAQQATVYRWKGSTCSPDDFLPGSESLRPDASVRLASVGGRSSNGTLPFFQLAWTDGGLCVAIGWSGQWNAEVVQQGGRPDSRDSGVCIRAGIERIRTRLHPGESIRLPRILLVGWGGNDSQRGHNLYRRLAFEHYMPRIKGELVYPIIAHPSSYDELRNSNERNQTDIIRATHRAGLEGFWLDAYWFEGFFPEGVGNWAVPIEQTVRKKDYPHGIRPLADLTHQLGMKFILWFEPERVAPGTFIDRTCPAWVLRAGKQGDGIFNLGLPEARRWMTDYLCRCIEAYAMDVLRIDHNIDPLPHWRSADAPDRQGMTEIRCVTGLYEMWDEILHRFPHIFIDNCASGGRRIDLETNLRSIPMWRSDYNDNNVVRGDPIADQIMSMGLSVFMPLHAGPAWRTDPYYWRSANVGGPIPYWDMRKDDFSHEQLRLAVKEAQALRPFFQGDFWLLTDNTADSRAWVAYQYHRPAQDDGCACVFRRKDSPYRAMEVSFRGLSAEKTYELAYHDGYNRGRTAMHSGQSLRKLPVEILERNGSLMLTYRRTSP